MLVALKSNKIDGYISEKPSALSAVYSNPDVSFVEFNNNNGFKYDRDDVNIAIGLKKGNDELRSEVEKALESISKEEREKLIELANLMADKLIADRNKE